MKIAKPNIVLIVILIFYLVYAGFFIYRTSFIVGGERYFVLFDDPMISMRYAKNLATGHGLVWNPGEERVEGATNPLWVFYMAIFHLFPIAPSKMSLIIQLSGALFLAINLIICKKLAELVSDGSGWTSVGAVILTAFYYPLNNISLRGFEVCILAPVLTLAALKTVKCLKAERFSILPYILLGIGTFVRIDMAVPLIGLLIFLIAEDRRHRVKHIIFGTAAFAFFIGTQTIFRVLYYGELLPNTYYLKMTGYPLLARISWGIELAKRFILDTNPLVFAIPFVALLFKRNKFTLLLLWLFLLQLVYSIYVGGDVRDLWERGANRYVGIAITLFFILLAYGIEKIAHFLGSYLAKRYQARTPATAAFTNVLFVVMLLASFIGLNFYSHEALKKWLLITEPQPTSALKEGVEIANLVTEITDKEAKVAVLAAGIVPYLSNRCSIDLLGKNDKKIAREKVRVSPLDNKLPPFYPGHIKWNFEYSIGELKPDVIVQLWGWPFNDWWQIDAKPYLENSYIAVEWKESKKIYLLKDSPHILWDKLKNI